MRWLGTDAAMEPHAGGLYLVNVGGKYKARGRFTEVIPVHRLAYSFGWEDREKMPPGSSLIEIDLIDQGGATLLRMTHSGLPDAEECASHEKGWTHYLERLAVVAAGGDRDLTGSEAAIMRARKADRSACGTWLDRT